MSGSIPAASKLPPRGNQPPTSPPTSGSIPTAPNFPSPENDPPSSPPKSGSIPNAPKPPPPGNFSISSPPTSSSIPTSPKLPPPVKYIPSSLPKSGSIPPAPRLPPPENHPPSSPPVSGSIPTVPKISPPGNYHPNSPIPTAPKPPPPGNHPGSSPPTTGSIPTSPKLPPPGNYLPSSPPKSGSIPTAPSLPPPGNHPPNSPPASGSIPTIPILSPPGNYPPPALFPLTSNHLPNNPPPLSSSGRLNSSALFFTDSITTFSSYQGPGPQFWSNPATWLGGVVPGIGNMTGANATIPCGQNVILDLPNITVGLLRVQGLLQFLDDPSVPLIHVKANFVLVEGQLFIGSESHQYSQMATIELTPNTAYNRSDLKYTGPAAPADPDNPRTLGHKAFAVVGGQVGLHGLPGPPSMPVWVRLGHDASAGDKVIQVAADLGASWPIGAQIVITSTDYERSQTETFNIVKVSSTGFGQSIIALDKSLVYNHYGTFNGLSDGYGGFVDERAEVILISRNIKITGTDEPAPHDLEGGHFMIFMTPTPTQVIEGVEFYKMGQQGKLGRYPLHLHILGSAPLTVVRKNSIHQSKQRCIVNHASHNIKFDSNVAFNTSGHCFVLEEGGEQNNTWINNIGVQTNPVSTLISSSDTDNNPATFWITNSINTYIGNVAAGAANAGFWFELRYAVRGDSLSIPSISGIIPLATSITLFYNNTAHSNDAVGLRTYPLGMQPRVSWNVFGATNVMDGIVCYKNVWTGMFVHDTDSLVITNSVFADNGWSLSFDRSQLINITNTTFVGLTNNYGNPKGCSNPDWTDCKPVDPGNCRVPVSPGVPARSTGWMPITMPSFGIVVNQGDYLNYWPYTLKNNKFSNFDASCHMMAGILMIGKYDYWNPSFSIKGQKFTNNSLPIWSAPSLYQLSAFGGLFDSGEQSMFNTIYDKDGSLTGGSPGYIVANTTQILPPGLAGCQSHPTWNAYTCTDVCYRSVWISYPEPGFGANPANAKNSHGQFSYLKVTRVLDGQQLLLDGDLQEINPNNGERNFMMNLLGNQIYNVEILSSASNLSFLATQMTVQIADTGECGQGLTLRFLQVANQPWLLVASKYLDSKLCPGVNPFPDSYSNAQYAPVCVNSQPWLEITFSAGFNNILPTPYMYVPLVVLTRGASNDEGKCVSTSNCSLLWSSTTWLYDDSGLERRPDFYNPILLHPENWKSGIAPLGNTWQTPWASWLGTIENYPNRSSLMTYYYRQNFNLLNSSCYSALLLDIIARDAIVVYLNGVEAVRFNMPLGRVNNSTTALGAMPWFLWQPFNLPLNSSSPFSVVDGNNSISVEQHMAYWPGAPVFDMKVTAVKL